MNTMIEKVVEAALKLLVFTFSPNKPYTWASGIKSPVYNNNRLPLSFPVERQIYLDALVETVRKIGVSFDCIIGVPTGGIAWATMLGKILGVPIVLLDSNNSPVLCDFARPEKIEKLHRGIKGRTHSMLTIASLAGNGSIFYGTQIAYDLVLPFAYIREQAKGHGLELQIEGSISKESDVWLIDTQLPGEKKYTAEAREALSKNKSLTLMVIEHAYLQSMDLCTPYSLEGKRVLVLEDLVSKATSLTSKVVEPVRAQGGIVEHIACMFNYGLFPAVDEKMKEAGCTLYPVYTFKDLLAGLESSNSIPESDLAQIKKWAEDPDKWSNDWIISNEPTTNEA